ncbi:MAG TPA: hypothetical protein VGC65_05495, partial [Bacteroidia bacterium]
SASAQKTALYNDPAHVRTFLGREPELDTVLLIIDEDHYTVPWKVYFDEAKTKLAFESVIHGDTCIESTYWRSSGKLKKKDKNYKVDGDYKWIYEELYCENGQLIRKDNPNNPAEEKVVNYYCNGKKKNEFTMHGINWEGPFTKWYENGQMESFGHYIKTQKDGEWKYWNEKGDLLITEIYKTGVLIESKK